MDIDKQKYEKNPGPHTTTDCWSIVIHQIMTAVGGQTYYVRMEARSAMERKCKTVPLRRARKSKVPCPGQNLHAPGVRWFPHLTKSSYSSQNLRTRRRVHGKSKMNQRDVTQEFKNECACSSWWAINSTWALVFINNNGVHILHTHTKQTADTLWKNLFEKFCLHQQPNVCTSLDSSTWTCFFELEK